MSPEFPQLLVRSALPYLLETKCNADGEDLAGFEDGDTRHLRDDDSLGADVLRFHRGLTILEQHGENLL